MIDIKKGEQLEEFVALNEWNNVLNDYFVDLVDEKKSHEKIKETLSGAASVFEKYEIKYNADDYESLILYHEGVIELLTDAIKEFEDKIETKQQHCDHEWKEIGHDSHYSYYFCDKCGKEERW